MTANFHRGIPLSESQKPKPESMEPIIHCGNCKAVLASADYVYASGATELRCVNCGFINTVVAGRSKKSETNSVVPTREQILRDALQIVTKDRNQDYGNPEDNFSTIAEYWTTYLQSKHLIPRSENLVASDVAAMMILMKCSRLATSPNKLDHWIDIAGYSSCGGDCVQ